MPIDRPIIMLGPPRSGKSMVARLLAEQPGFLLAFEPQAVWATGRTHADDRRTADDADPRAIERIRARIAALLDAHGATRFVDDLPHHALRVPFVNRVLPEARFILLTRDGRDTVREMLYGWRHKDSVGQAWKRRMTSAHGVRSAGLLRTVPLAMRWGRNRIRQFLGGRKWTWGPTVPGQHAFATTHALPATVGFQWSELVRIVREDAAQVPPDRLLELRYEDVRADPAAAARRLAAFAEVPDPETLAARASAEIERDRTTYADPLPPDDWAAILPTIESMQVRLGYPIDPPPPHDGGRS